MDAHVTAICQSAFYHLRNINSIRKYLTQNATLTLIHAFVTSRLDNGNSMLYGISKASLCKLQRIQNSAARTVAKIRKFDHITPVLIELHWLPVRQRIMFKLILFTWRALHGESPQYLSDMIVRYTPSRVLESMDTNLLVVPRTKMQTSAHSEIEHLVLLLQNFGTNFQWKLDH